MAEQIPFSVVEKVLSSLGSSVVQKLGSMYGVGNELEKLAETLGTLNAVLLDAEEQQHLEKSHAVKDWVKRLKRVVYDVDDLVDDFATYQLRRGGGGPARQVSHFLSCSSNQVAFRFQMSGRLDDIKEALDEIKRDICLLTAIPRNTIHSRAENTRRETHSSTSINHGLRNDEIDHIVNLLVSPENDQDTFIVAICGIGGLGKTTLAQLVYNVELVKKHFEPKIWVCVADDDDSSADFGEKALLKKITKSEHDKSVEDLKKTLDEKLSQKKYLLVLDDVWNKRREAWEKVRPLLEVGAQGSKILVTTRNTEVSFMGNNTRPFELKGLGQKESWNLFSKITFGGQEINNVSEEIINVGRQIVEMCRGVPLIINTLGGILMQFKSDLSKWESIRRNENLLSLPHGNDNVLRVLKLSYDNLPTHLKQCFTYCALFPQDYEIDKKLLVQLWIAQGYIQSPNGDEQLENIGDRYFEELVSRSLLEKVEEDGSNDGLTFKMHDLIHDLAQSIVGSEFLVLRNDVSNISREARHISLLFEMKAIMEKKAIAGKSIRTFLNLYPDFLKDTTILNSFLPSVACLRVLSLHGLDIGNVPKSLGKLIHLRYLDLSNNNFEILPNSITRLKNLQTLKLQDCFNLKKFPKDMRELTNLRHLQNDDCSDLTHMPHGIGKLTSLQSLPLFVVGNGMGKGRSRNHKVGSLSELESLDQLRGELCIRNLENVRDVKLVSKPQILEKKKYLESLRLEWGERSDGMMRGDKDGDHKSVMECLRPNPKLKKLFIDGYGAEEFPVTWELKEGEGSSATPVLLFPSLESLTLRHMPKLKELWRMEGPSICQLSILEITECNNLPSLELHSSPSLSKLKIKECNKLASLELHSSPSLSELEINECNNLASLELHSSPSLSKLEINNCSDLASLELHSSPSLSKLKINKCPNLASLELHSSHGLSELKINECNNLTSLNVASLTSLEELTLGGVRTEVLRQIIFVSASSSLKSLSILEIDCGTIIADPEEEQEPLLYVSTLQTLSIWNCSGLATLLHWMGNLSSLTYLRIDGCPELRSLPEQIYSLQKLQTLYLCGSPHLEQRYNKQTGEDQAKIAHIPHVYFHRIRRMKLGRLRFGD